MPRPARPDTGYVAVTNDMRLLALAKANATDHGQVMRLSAAAALVDHAGDLVQEGHIRAALTMLEAVGFTADEAKTVIMPMADDRVYMACDGDGNYHRHARTGEVHTHAAGAKSHFHPRTPRRIRTAS